MFLRPRTLHDATQALAAGGQVIAGGTDFFPALGTQPARGRIIDVSRVEEMRGIQFASNHIRIGGATTWSEIARASLPRGFGALRSAARQIGAVQVQNRGTIAGNLCNASPAADGIPPLLILDAEVELSSSSGTRRIALQEFVVGNRKTGKRPDELLSAVFIPTGKLETPSAFLKLGARRYLVISISMVAAMLGSDGEGRVNTARVAVGACSAAAQRLHELECDLTGRPLHSDLAEVVAARHLSPLSAIDDVRATASYRKDATLSLIRRALLMCMGVRS